MRGEIAIAAEARAEEVDAEKRAAVSERDDARLECTLEDVARVSICNERDC